MKLLILCSPPCMYLCVLCKELPSIVTNVLDVGCMTSCHWFSYNYTVDSFQLLHLLASLFASPKSYSHHFKCSRRFGNQRFSISPLPWQSPYHCCGCHDNMHMFNKEKNEKERAWEILLVRQWLMYNVKASSICQ